MNKNLIRAIGILLIIGIIIIGIYEYHRMQITTAPSTTDAKTVSYLCRDGKSIDAVYSESSVTLTLSDTRGLVLPHVVSGSGTRYEQGTTVFISKGTSASLEENGSETYVDCIANQDQASGTNANGMKSFTDGSGTFSFIYPSTVTVSGGDGSYTESWMNNATTLGMVLATASLSKSFQPNTNFSEGTLVVGTSADATAVQTCRTFAPTGGPTQKVTTATINGVEYTILHSSDAGAGNRYDTTSYRTVRNSQCYNIEYTIHSTNIGNYSPDQHIEQFDSSVVQKVLDGIVQSFRFTER